MKLLPLFHRHVKPSAHSAIFVAGNRDLVFCRQRRKRMSSIFDIEDRRQGQKSFICVCRTQQVFVAEDEVFVAEDEDFCRQRRKRMSSIFDIEDRSQGQKSFICVCRTQQVFVASDKNPSSSATKIVLCALGLSLNQETMRVSSMTDRLVERGTRCRFEDQSEAENP